MTDNELKQKLTPEQYEIMRKGGTEAPFSGEYVTEHSSGMYKCAACGQNLFSSETKFDSGTGWPSFTDAVNREHIDLIPDESHGMLRVEVKCKNCGSHLGHVFDDLPDGRQVAPGQTKDGKRYCINSACLKLEKKDE